jgi:hypothetical protein
MEIEDGQAFYIVHENWMKQWMWYIGYGEISETDSESSKKSTIIPDEISNEDLLNNKEKVLCLKE